MGKRYKILIFGTVVLLAIVGLVYWFKNRDVLKIEKEDTPFNLTWGMSPEEVEIIMENENCEMVEIPNSMAYKIFDFQGIEGANCITLLHFEEESLYSTTCLFSMKSAYNELILSEEMVAQLKAGFEKAYKKQCEEVWAVQEPMGLEDCYYLHKESLVELWLSEDHLYVSFSDRDHSTTRQVIAGLQAK